MTITAGASGYLLKSMSEEELLQTLDRMEAGEAPLTTGLTTRIMSEFARRERISGKPAEVPPGQLSERQTEIVKMVAQGRTYPQIAGALGLSEATIRYHIGTISRQLHLENRAQIIAWANRYLAIE